MHLNERKLCSVSANSSRNEWSQFITKLSPPAVFFLVLGDFLFCFFVFYIKPIILCACAPFSHEVALITVHLRQKVWSPHIEYETSLIRVGMSLTWLCQQAWIPPYFNCKYTNDFLLHSFNFSKVVWLI